MTDRQRHSIRRVIRFRNILQTAEPLNHIHDLVLFRFPVAGYRLLYLHRRILIDRNAGALAGQQNSPPPVSRMTPLPCATAMPVVIFLSKKSSSTETASGEKSRISSPVSS